MCAGGLISKPPPMSKLVSPQDQTILSGPTYRPPYFFSVVYPQCSGWHGAIIRALPSSIQTTPGLPNRFCPHHRSEQSSPCGPSFFPGSVAGPCPPFSLVFAHRPVWYPPTAAVKGGAAPWCLSERPMCRWCPGPILPPPRRGMGLREDMAEDIRVSKSVFYISRIRNPANRRTRRPDFQDF